jgi:iron(III) transport system ATP-binding protein
MPDSLELHRIDIAYAGPRGPTPVVSQLSLRLAAGEIGCLLGRSGSGKSTVLRAIAGFEPVRAGEILLAGKVLSSTMAQVAPEARQIGMMFQDYALFPHLSVQDNVVFGLRQWSAAERAARCNELLDLVDLQAQATRFPHQLSGGQQQRVALARALAPRPKLLLLDEPFSNLDSRLRETLALQVRNILKHEGISALLVTHDQDECFALADRVGILDKGQIAQWDTPYEIYHQPRSRMVAEFIGQGAFLPGTVLGADQVQTELGALKGVLATECNGGNCLLLGNGAPVDVLLRPDDVVHDDHSELTAVVEQRVFRGAYFLYTLRLPSGLRLLSYVPSHHDHPLGESIGIRLALDHVVAFKGQAPATFQLDENTTQMHNGAA